MISYPAAQYTVTAAGHAAQAAYEASRRNAPDAEALAAAAHDAYLAATEAG